MVARNEMFEGKESGHRVWSHLQMNDESCGCYFRFSEGPQVGAKR